MNELALFAGAGGGLLATKWLLGWRTVCYVENNPYRVKVLKARIRDRLLDDAPIWDDARTFDGRSWRGSVDIITAGFPCQPFSVAGKRKADSDERNLWPDTIRIIREVRPTWCLLENVPGLLSNLHGYFGQVLKDLAESGYDVKWRMLSAAEVGAPHRRNRLWILGTDTTTNQRQSSCTNSNSPRSYFAQTNETRQGIQIQSEYEQERIIEPLCSDVANAPKIHVQRFEDRQTQRKFGGSDWWTTEPRMGRVANGVANEVDRLEALGDGQVPAVVKVIWELLTE